MTIAPDNKKKPSFTFVCGADERFGPGCGRSLTLDERFKNREGTKKVPLEYSYDSVGQIQLQPHKCPVKEEARRNQGDKIAKDVEQMKVEVQEIKADMSTILYEIQELKKLFQPQPLGV